MTATLPHADELARILASLGGIEGLRERFMVDGSYRLTPIGNLAGRYLDDLRFENYSPSTITGREQTLSWLAFDHPDLDPAAVTLEMLTEFLRRHWADAKPNTKNIHVSALRCFFAWCLDHDHITADPARRLKSPRRTDTERRSHSQATIRKLVLAQDSHRDRVAILTLYWCALRRSELRLVQFRHIDLANRRLTVFGKGHKIVEQHIPEPLALELERHILERQAQPDEFLLYPFKIGRRGAWPEYETVVVWENRYQAMTRSGLEKWWHRCRRRAGMDEGENRILMHELRHSAGTHVHEAGGDLVATQHFMRHADPRVTERSYIHLDRARLVARVQRQMPDPMADE